MADHKLTEEILVQLKKLREYGTTNREALRNFVAEVNDRHQRKQYFAATMLNPSRTAAKILFVGSGDNPLAVISILQQSVIATDNTGSVRTFADFERARRAIVELMALAFHADEMREDEAAA